MTIIQLKIPVLSLVLRSKKQLETRKESAATEAVSSQWMKFLLLCAIDLSGRPYFSWDAEFTSERSEICPLNGKRVFLCYFLFLWHEPAYQSTYQWQQHHVAEAMFKSFSKALDQAVSYDPRITDVLSTKGSLA